MNLAVFGASGPTGRLVVRQALAAGHDVTAVTRKPDEFPFGSPNLSVVGADVTDPDGVERALSGPPEAVISTFGVPYSKDEITVYSQGIAGIVRAMTLRGVTRLVCVSSTSVPKEEAPGQSLFFRKVLHPFLRNRLGRTLYDDMERMEGIVRSSGLDWTIVRPGGLFDASEPTEDYEVSPQRLPGPQVTSRADLAQALVREATGPRHPRSTVEVITRSGTPGPMNFLKEAFGIGG